ncbi:tRNA(Ile)-lysidine synthase [Chlorella sorokiniana]|uniref:tRNA(Ile)-lysidine synthetase n=1 Tax=Chlorella sorokiniana TaxID=3076 RepID=A0A2P6TQ55_CHLSO|nr:tRNA(Ile)-lysidine synthase [Chlorella sorokiniana]|eukprot:PRW56165.1 tRNA(Ile)-lysidine synthase [Chlorella sorokiniana]
MASGSGPLGRFVSALRGCGVQPGDRVAVALSGGPDSLALAAMTVWWHGFTRSREAPLALIVDHQLRPESSEEAAAVARRAEELGMQARVLRVDWPAGQLPSLGEKMAAAREARYDLLLRACGEAERGALLLAHHADDQAETFLLRLMHASGVLGLACMPPAADKRTEWGRVRLLRPLLDFRKSELEDYCRQRGLEYVVDPTNAELSFHRNRIRHVLQLATLQQEKDAQASSGGSLESQASQHEELPSAPRKRQPRPRQRMTQAQLKRQWLEQQPWFLNWDKRLEQVADALRPLRFALLDASCFAGLDEPVAVGALSRILQAVSGRKYPPPLTHTVRLHTRLLPGRLDATYTGGGCLVRRLPRCKGRYLVCVTESDWPAAEAALAQLPPPTTAEAERRQQKQQQRQAEAQLDSLPSSNMAGAEGDKGEASLPVPPATPA